LNRLAQFEREVTIETNRLLSERRKYSTFKEFLRAHGLETKRRSGFNSQVVCDITRSIWKKQKACQHVNGATIKFNVPRNCKTFETKGFFFVELGVYPRDRIAVPIKKNLNFIRFLNLIKDGWTCKTFGLTPLLEICAYLSKEKEVPRRRSVVGIDINNKNFAYTVLTPDGEILKQGYLCQHIWPKKVHFAQRRAMLQSLRALKKLKRMRYRQKNFVYTTIGQMVKEIISLAVKFNADVSIEKLSRFNPLGRKFDKKVLTLPLYIFRRILEARCFDHDIMLSRVDPYHTSKWCTRCGAVAKNGHTKNYSLFRCQVCDLVLTLIGKRVSSSPSNPCWSELIRMPILMWFRFPAGESQ
jgi:IS605 OrfB family transposase